MSVDATGMGGTSAMNRGASESRSKGDQRQLEAIDQNFHLLDLRAVPGRSTQLVRRQAPLLPGRCRWEDKYLLLLRNEIQKQVAFAGNWTR